ncbi:serine/threonine-protein kinase SRPK3 [Stagonosporopsis vannaccii]|nr:serine/threonine-protein kinase SRPK3 [Stagonosporopsis vannaccii]
MASPPPTPPTELPRNSDEWRFENNSAPCEWAEEYRPGGFHPVKIGDTFHDGRYKVIRKLGEGSFSTVWLAVSSSVPKYAALKITMAKSPLTTKELVIMKHLTSSAPTDPRSQHIIKLLDDFQHEGPNGIHQCLILEVMAASAASLVHKLPENQPRQWRVPQRYPKAIAKKTLLHTLKGLSLLHENGVVHSDVQPGNLLFLITDLDHLEQQQLEQSVTMLTIPLHRTDRKVDKWAPLNLYRAQSLHDHIQLGPGLCVKLSDFGAAFFAADPPYSTITPSGLRAPELILKQPFGAGIDIWSFGCLMYEFLTGEALFTVNVIGCDQEDQDDADDEHLCQLNDIIRPLSDSMMSAWPRSSKWFDADHNHLQPDEEEDLEKHDRKAGVSKSEEEVGGKDEDEEPYVYDTLEQRFANQKHPDIDEEEADVICRLIRSILVYDPAQRPTAEELLQHPWFSERTCTVKMAQ